MQGLLERPPAAPGGDQEAELTLNAWPGQAPGLGVPGRASCTLIITAAGVAIIIATINEGD